LPALPVAGSLRRPLIPKPVKMANTPEGQSPTRPLALLVVQAGPRIGEELPVTTPHCNIGSGSQNDLVLDDDSVSKQHALLEYTMGAWRLTDLESTNGTFVEGVRMAPQVPTPLTLGASLRFGGLRLHFRPVAEADPEAASAAYTPPERPVRVAERTGGFRLPLWVAIAIALVVIALTVGIYSWWHPGTGPAPTPPQTEMPAPPPPGEPQPLPATILDDTVPAGDSPMPPGDTLPPADTLVEPAPPVP
jgi:pSer/pThr/pTyr-binding forkhead associated (FHA) protein